MSVTIWTVLPFLIVGVAFFGLVVAALVKYVFGLGKRDPNTN